MGAEKLKVKLGLGGKRIFDVAVQVDGQQTAAVVRAERYLTAGVGRDGAEAQVGIAVGQRLAGDGVPEEHTRLGRAPRIVDNLAPESRGIYLLCDYGRVGVDGVLLCIYGAVGGSLHESVVDAHRHVGTGDLTLGHLGVDKGLGLGVLYRHGEHERSAAAILGHLAGRVGVALHEGYDAGGGKGGVFDRHTFGPDMRQVVTHAAAALHQLYLLLVDAEHAAVGVGAAVETYHKAVAQRAYLEIVADACHGAALGHDVAEIAHELKYLVVGHRLGILLLNAYNLRGQAMVHIVGRELVYIAL